jgi:hypothetical protein
VWCFRCHKLYCQHTLLLLLLLLATLLLFTPTPECLEIRHLRPSPLGNCRRLLH